MRHPASVSLSEVSHLQNPHRLPRTVLPRRYELSLTPDLGAAAFTGTVTIACECVEATNEIAVNAKELQILSVTVNGTSRGFRLHDETERLEVQAALVHSARLVTLGEMTTSIAHEISQTLFAISLAAQNALEALPVAQRGSVPDQYADSSGSSP